MTQASSRQQKGDEQLSVSYAAGDGVSKAVAGLRVNVVGAGLVGCVIARVLAEHGALVRVVDENEPGSGASGVPLGAMHPWTGIRPRCLTSEQLSAWRATQAFFESRAPYSLHSAPWLLRLPPNSKTAEIWKRRFDAPEYSPAEDEARWVGPETCRTLQPGLGGAVTIFGGLLVPRVPLYNVRALCVALLELDDIDLVRRRCIPTTSGVPLLDGAEPSDAGADDVWVVAVGAAADQWTSEHLLKPMKGELLVVETESDERLRGIVGYRSHITPVAPRRWLLSSTYEESEDPMLGEGGETGWGRLLARLLEVLPSRASGVRVVGAWAGIRPVPADLGTSRGSARIVWRDGPAGRVAIATGTASRGLSESLGLANALLESMSAEKSGPKNDETPS
jgi:glycine/D-amino acid oxidase-like deaminating enzyme